MNCLESYVSKMKEQGYIIDILNVKMRNRDFYVQINIHSKYLKTKKGVIAKLLFEKIGTDNKLEVLIDDTKMYNLDGSFAEYQKLVSFFGSYNNALGQINQSLVKEFNQNMPSEFCVPKGQKILELKQRVQTNDIDFWKKQYLTHVRKLSKGTRSIEIDEKTSLLRPKIYAYFIDDEEITFCWSDNKLLEKDDDEIKALFSKNKGK